MILILIVICSHVHYKVFEHVNIGKVYKNYLLVTYLFSYLLADDVILLMNLVPGFNCK